ncbi:MAG: hypothetical protein NTW31_08290 [Bacteroidetes bacterium]|nr:hypothetical protein [Bacteroidota bacterium]
MDYSKQIQDIASKLFADDKIDVFVGYCMNGFDDNQVPVVITDPKEVQALVFTEKSVFNLSNYLKADHTRGKRVGLVVKGCDSRSLNLLLTENQVKRDKLYIIGIACEGVVDDRGQKMQNCMECIVPDAVVFDEMLGTPKGKKDYIVNADITELAAKGLVERREYFEEIFDNCIRCNACRHSCPLCYDRL